MQKKIWLSAICWLLPALCLAQSNGIDFEQNLGFQQLLQKARTENKYVFVDCYASWCGPCMLMDKQIYPNDTVGTFFNRHFLSIKLQMDTAKLDNEQVRSHYADAHQLSSTYTIKAFPTFLFFSPDGKIVHRGLGYQGTADLIKLAANAMDTTRQYYTLLAAYNTGIIDSNALCLVTTARAIGDNRTAIKISRSYVNTLLKLPAVRFYTGDTYNLIVTSTQTSKDPGFHFLYLHAAEMDKVIGGSQPTEDFISYIIAKEDVDPVLKIAADNHQANFYWYPTYLKIDKKYNRFYANKVITDAKLRWYGAKQNWRLYCEVLTGKFNAHPKTADPNELDEAAWDIFLHSKDQSQFHSAIRWIKIAIDQTPNDIVQKGPYLDTYANLLYKMGKTQKAIVTERQALAVAKKANIDFNIKEFNNTLQKMQNGQ